MIVLPLLYNSCTIVAMHQGTMMPHLHSATLIRDTRWFRVTSFLPGRSGDQQKVARKVLLSAGAIGTRGSESSVDQSRV